MGFWLVEIAETDGASSMRRVRAPSADTVCDVLDVHPARILAVRRDWWQTINTAKPDLGVQTLFIAQLAAMVASGADLSGVPALMANNQVLRRAGDASAWTPSQPISRLLAALDFDPAVAPLVAAGEQAGRLSEALQDAVDYLSERRDRKRANAGKLLMAGMLAVGVTLGFTTMPLLLSDQLDRMTQMRAAGLMAAPSVPTQLLYALRDWGSDVLRAVLMSAAALVTVVWWRADAWIESPRWAWFVRPIQYLRAPQRGVNLLSVLRPMFAAGVSPEDMATAVRAALGPAGDALIRMQDQGHSLSEAVALTSAWWSPTLVRTLRGFESALPQDRDRLFRILIQAMNEEQRDRQSRLAVALYGFAMAAAVLLVLLLALGALLPMSMGIRVSG
ncbi:MAG: type II secretion system F family protein [Gammaproteobacteria bacterium]|nr:type II secretion system F family protein [Gammaproteobacteria bacterium]